jgi:SAM-dependent methyltransferase
MSTKTTQGQLWSIAPQDWVDYFEPYFLPMYRIVLEQVSLTENTMLLDAGCGSGLFCSMAIETGAQVTGIDAAPGLLEIARRRNPQSTFLEEDLEAMPFADNTFHVVTGFNSFQYAEKFENALRETKRVLRKGGQLVIGIWDKPEVSDATHILKEINFLVPPPPPGTPGPFALSEEGKIESICREADLKVIYKTTVACPILYRNMLEGVKSFMSTGPAAIAMNYTDKNTVENTIARALRPFRVTEDLYFMQNYFLVFIIEK